MVEDEEPSGFHATGDAETDASRRKQCEASDRDFARGLRWRRFFVAIFDVSFDVQKTDSLVSPYTGVLEFECDDSQSPRLLREQALAYPQKECKAFCSEQYRVLYVYQEGRWVVKSVQTRKKPDEIHPYFRWEWDPSKVMLLPTLRRAIYGN